MIHSTLDAQRHWATPASSEHRDPAVSVPPRLDITKLIAPLQLAIAANGVTAVPSGQRRELSRPTTLMMHFVKSGSGWLASENRPSVSVFQNSLVIVSPGHPTTLRAASSPSAGAGHIRFTESDLSNLARYDESTGEGLVVFSAAISAAYTSDVGLFDSLRGPLIERLEVGSACAMALADIERELAARDCGMDAMLDAMLRQIVVQVLRRSMASGQAWSERFGAFEDERIARCLINMANTPGANHSTVRMASEAGLSRSFFMRRFHEAFGVTPGAVLRQLRMRRAVVLLRGDQLSVGRISEEVGYASRSSFLRAFRQTYGCEPSDYDDSCPEIQPARPREARAAPHPRGRAESRSAPESLECVT